jgi:hypothetical protein
MDYFLELHCNYQKIRYDWVVPRGFIITTIKSDSSIIFGENILSTSRADINKIILGPTTIKKPSDY